MPRSRLDVDEVVSFDNGCDIAVDELTSVLHSELWPATVG
jgi:hypothetical protein